MADTPDATPETDKLDSTQAEASTPDSAKDPDDGPNKKIADRLKARMETCKKTKNDLVADWKANVDARMGKVTNIPALVGVANVDDDTQTPVNPDWSLTKIKTSNLFSQVPEVQGSHENKQYEAAVPCLLKALNYELGAKRMNLGASIEEALNDCVNAAGVGAIYIGYEATTEKQKVPTGMDSVLKLLPPAVVQAGVKAGLVPTKEVQHVIDSRLFAHRISPLDLLWMTDFNGSDFNDSDALGFTGRMPWARAKSELKLTDDDKDTVIGNEPPQGGTETSLRSDTDKSNPLDSQLVTYDVLYYWRNRFDPDEKFFKAIWKIVFVRGKTEPVIHEPYSGQKLAGKSYVGVTRLPVTVLTLTYVTDNPIPPSDTEAGRPQVNDLRRSRAQMFQNRERSTPLRWFNTNLVDPLIHENMMRGTIQGMIPMNGDGSRAIGEVARASYPSEDLTFDINSKQDLIESWMSQPQAAATTSRQNKEQVQAAQATMASRSGQERNRTTAFFLNLCDVTLGLMVLYSDFPILTPQEKDILKKTWDGTKITHDLVLKVRPDSTIVLDSNQRLDKIFKFMNFTVKSGMVNPKPLLVEAAELSGIDPADVVVDPKPPKPPDPNVSFRFSGKQDLMNPVVMAILVQAGIAPSPEMLEAAKKLLSAMQEPAAPPAPPQPGAPPGPGHPPAPPPAGGHPGAPAPGTPEAHPHWSLGGRIAKRNRDASGG